MPGARRDPRRSSQAITLLTYTSGGKEHASEAGHCDVARPDPENRLTGPHRSHTLKKAVRTAAIRGESGCLDHNRRTLPVTSPGQSATTSISEGVSLTTETTTTDIHSSQQLSPCRREITVEIPADVVSAETDAVVLRYQKLGRVPGFRKGKVPASIVRQRFADEIKSEIVEALVPRYFREETQKQNLQPVSQPRVTDLNLQQGEPLRFKASFEIRPQFKVAAYDDIRVEKVPTEVTEDEVERALHNLRQRQATFSPVEEERPLADGDFAVVGFNGTPKDGEPDAKPVAVEEVMVEIGGADTIPEFTENLRGAKPGDQRSFEVKYADDFSDKRLAGKTMT